MKDLAKQYITTHLTKIITLIFSILFIISFFITSDKINMLTYSVVVGLIVLNVYDLITSTRVSSFFEALIYEMISVLGIYFIGWFYVLVFVLVAEIVNIFKNKTLLTTTIVFNSILFISIYFIQRNDLVYRGIYLWQIILLLFVTVSLSIYFVNHEEIYQEESEKDSEENEIKQKYLELLKEHQDVLLLKNIMDLSNHPTNINDLVRQINELLLEDFADIDFSTVLLYNDKRKEFRIVTTNISMHHHESLCNIDKFDEFEDVVNSNHGKILSSEIGLIYPTASERSIMSAFCVPLHTQKEFIGAILMESQSPYAFKNMDINKFNLVRYNISLIVENKIWVEKIEKMALVDGLTGVYNRNYLFEFLENQMKWHKENSKKLCMVLFDVDHFKNFNDTYGHLFGDLVLKEICRMVKDSIRDTDLIARYGGEEFIIVLIGADAQAAKSRIEQIRLKIQDSTIISEEGVKAKVTVSFGISEFNEECYDFSIKDLIERADKAVYKSKDEGRNRVSIYNSNM